MLNWKKIPQSEVSKIDGKVLIVDDEEHNLKLLENLLSRKFNVITASSAKEALDKIKDKELGVIVSDQRMPDMSGTEMFEVIERQNHPALRIILTGYADIQTVVDAINSGKVYRFMSKPVEKNDLLQTVQSAMSQFHIAQTNLRLISQIKKVMEENATLSKQIHIFTGKKIEREEDSLTFQRAQMIKLAIMNIDLRGFSLYSRGKKPENIINTLQEIYEPIYNLIHKKGGIIDKHMGDGLMALFGLDGDTGIDSGLSCLEEIVSMFPEFKQKLSDGDAKHLKMGIGLAFGDVIMGMLGDATRYELAVIGQAANLSSRLQEYSKAILAGRSMLEPFKNIIGITYNQNLHLSQNFKEFSLKEMEVIRDFEEIRNLFYISN